MGLKESIGEESPDLLTNPNDIITIPTVVRRTCSHQFPSPGDQHPDCLSIKIRGCDGGFTMETGCDSDDLDQSFEMDPGPSHMSRWLERRMSSFCQTVEDCGDVFNPDDSNMSRDCGQQASARLHRHTIESAEWELKERLSEIDREMAAFDNSFAARLEEISSEYNSMNESIARRREGAATQIQSYFRMCRVRNVHGKVIAERAARAAQSEKRIQGEQLRRRRRAALIIYKFCMKVIRREKNTLTTCQFPLLERESRVVGESLSCPHSNLVSLNKTLRSNAIGRGTSDNIPSREADQGRLLIPVEGRSGECGLAGGRSGECEGHVEVPGEFGDGCGGDHRDGRPNGDGAVGRSEGDVGCSGGVGGEHETHLECDDSEIQGGKESATEQKCGEWGKEDNIEDSPEGREDNIDKSAEGQGENIEDSAEGQGDKIEDSAEGQGDNIEDSAEGQGDSDQVENSRTTDGDVAQDHLGSRLVIRRYNFRTIAHTNRGKVELEGISSQLKSLKTCLGDTPDCPPIPPERVLTAKSLTLSCRADLTQLGDLCANLTELCCTDCGITSIPRLLDCCPLISRITLRSNLLEKCDVSDLRRLTRLDVSRNKLTALPGVTNCLDLVHLDVSSNNIDDLWFPQTLPCLMSLSCHNCALLSCEGLKFLPRLAELDLSANFIRRCRPVENYFITRLNIGHNYLRTVPDLSRAPLLVHLDVSNNNISDLGELSSWCLPHLKSLDLSQNCVSHIELPNALSLATLDIRGNPTRSVDLPLLLENLLADEDYTVGIDHATVCSHLYERIKSFGSKYDEATTKGDWGDTWQVIFDHFNWLFEIGPEKMPPCCVEPDGPVDKSDRSDGEAEQVGWELGDGQVIQHVEDGTGGDSPTEDEATPSVGNDAERGGRHCQEDPGMGDGETMGPERRSTSSNVRYYEGCLSTEEGDILKEWGFDNPRTAQLAAIRARRLGGNKRRAKSALSAPGWREAPGPKPPRGRRGKCPIQLSEFEYVGINKVRIGGELADQFPSISKTDSKNIYKTP